MTEDTRARTTYLVWCMENGRQVPHICYDAVPAHIFSRAMVTHELTVEEKTAMARAMDERQKRDPHWIPNLVEIAARMIPPVLP